MAYVDGFVIAIPKKNVAAYKKMSTKAGKVWMEFGALAYVEAIGDDVNTKFGLPFPKLAKLKKGEVVIFSYIVYKSRAQRDRVNAKVMKDPRMDMDPKKMPFDVKRMSMGGFKSIVDM
ncbi:MAG: hypothetical protein K0Q70_2688 [Rhodospirillales bacterium]|jgi:uncharacterized protein YbaA (DUF1428 family)|nr:hypothetical protein [Rhodospirillales bacterium]